MKNLRIWLAGIFLFGLLAAAFHYANENANMATTTEPHIVSLQPFSPEWKLEDNEEALIILVHTHRNGLTEDQMKEFANTSKAYSGKVKFAYLNLTLEHPSFSNSVYATIYGINEYPTYILQRKGESAFEKHSGAMSAKDLQAFIDNNLTP